MFLNVLCSQRFADRRSIVRRDDALSAGRKESGQICQIVLNVFCCAYFGLAAIAQSICQFTCPPCITEDGAISTAEERRGPDGVLLKQVRAGLQQTSRAGLPRQSKKAQAVRQ